MPSIKITNLENISTQQVAIFLAAVNLIIAFVRLSSLISAYNKTKS